MVALYVTSLEKGSGKTAVCAGLGKRLVRDGKKIGFLKPIIVVDKNPPAEGVDDDADFMKRLFALEEPAGLLRPVFSNESNLSSGIKEAYARVSRGKDVIIVEGISDWSQVPRGIVEKLDARVIIVQGYSKELLKAIDSYKDFGESLLGVVVNKVPGSRVEQVRSETTTHLDKAGVNILGVLPEDRTLFALTVGEVAEHIQGEILSGAENSVELVENIMLGAMSVDPGPEYFGRKANKAVIVRSERPDMQLAALETPTRCLVLTGNTRPNPDVLYRAEEKKVPVILTSDDTTAVVASIEDALGEARFNHENKLQRFAEIMEQYFDFQAVHKGLGLTT